MGRGTERFPTVSTPITIPTRPTGGLRFWTITALSLITAATSGIWLYSREPSMTARYSARFSFRWRCPRVRPWRLAARGHSGRRVTDDPPGSLSRQDDGLRSWQRIGMGEAGSGCARSTPSPHRNWRAPRVRHGPFWSPDSQSIGFFADERLKTIDAGGGRPLTICPVPDFSRGGTWGDGTIVFSPGGGALERVAAVGGTPSPATTLVENESTHTRPNFLPDGRRFFFQANSRNGAHAIYVGSLDFPERTLVIKAADAANVNYSSGHLLFLRDTALMAQPFDTRRLALSGKPTPIAEQVRVMAWSTSALAFSLPPTTACWSIKQAPRCPDRSWCGSTEPESGSATSAIAPTTGVSPCRLTRSEPRSACSILSGRSDIFRSSTWLEAFPRDYSPLHPLEAPARRYESARWGPNRVWSRRARWQERPVPVFVDGCCGARAARERRVVALQLVPSGRFLLYRESVWWRDCPPYPSTATKTIRGAARGLGRARPVFTRRPLDRALLARVGSAGSVCDAVSRAGREDPRLACRRPRAALAPRRARTVLYLTPENSLVAVAVDGRGSTFDVGEARTLFGVQARWRALRLRCHRRRSRGFCSACSRLKPSSTTNVQPSSSTGPRC